MGLRKALGAVKDKITIGIIKASSTDVPKLKIAIVKATSHDNDPARGDRHIREIIALTDGSTVFINSCVAAISKRLSKTRDWIVALKVLVLVYRLLIEGDPEFVNKIVSATTTRRGTKLLDLSHFCDEAHSSSLDYTTFVRNYGSYLDDKVKFMVYEQKQSSGGNTNNVGELRSKGQKGREEHKPRTPLREMEVERIIERMDHLQGLLDRFLACRTTVVAKNSRMLMFALNPLVQESFKLHGDIEEVLSVLRDKFVDMEPGDSSKVFARVGKQYDELREFYNWSKKAGILRPSEYPVVQRVSPETLEKSIRQMEALNRKKIEDPQERVRQMEALNKKQPELKPEVKQPKQEPGDLIDLREGIMTTWQNPAAETGRADWEFALGESVSHLPVQNPALLGAMDLMLIEL